LKVNHRLAELTVLDQQTAADSEAIVTKIRFRELDDFGSSVGPTHDFEILGDVLYVDYWVVKFEDEYVQNADLQRGTSICLFRRIFGEHQEPKDGYVLDEVGTRPAAYGKGNQVSEFERKIWSDFWTIANDPDKAESLGIRAAHGEAVSTRLRPGKQYRVVLRSSGGLSISPARFDTDL
jgi:hypothetical protein